MNEDLKHTIYLPGDCLSEKILFDYIDNKLSHRERHIVEKHLLDCEMCSDAVEGLELVKDRNRIALIKEAIEKRLTTSVKKEAVVISFNYKLVFSVAATVALLVIGVFYFNTIGMKESAQADLAELKQNESPDKNSSPPPPPAPMDEKETSVSRNSVETGSTVVKSESENMKLRTQTVADQEIALAEEQKTESGYYKRFSSGDGELKNQQTIKENAANGAVVVADEISVLNDRKDNNLETVSIPKSVVTEREKSAKIDNAKKSEEGASSASGGTFASTSNPTPEQNKDKLSTTKSSESKTGDQTELSKKADKDGKYRAETKGKEKPAAGKNEPNTNEDVSAVGNVAYQPQSIAQDHDDIKSETKTTTNNTTKTISTNTTPVFEATIKADSSEQVYTIVEQMPEYPGGEVALIKAATKQLTYPPKDDASNSYGTIIIEFIVDSSGKATQPKLVKPKSADLEKQVIDFVNKMPKWKAGKQNNKNVSVKLVLPIKINVK